MNLNNELQLVYMALALITNSWILRIFFILKIIMLLRLDIKERFKTAKRALVNN